MGAPALAVGGGEAAPPAEVEGVPPSAGDAGCPPEPVAGIPPAPSPKSAGEPFDSDTVPVQAVRNPSRSSHERRAR